MKAHRGALLAGLIGTLLLAPSSALASTGWSAPASIDSHNLEGVSCPSSSFCAAVDNSGNALLYKRGSWSLPSSIDGATGFDWVSCPSASFCAAVDDAGNVLTYSGSSWSAPVSIDSSGAPFNSVSCPSASFCVAVDEAGNALTYSGSSWSAPVSIDAPNALYAVSCASASFCAAVDNNGNALTYDGSSWSAPVSIDPGYVPDGVSCPSASFCVAVDNRGDALTYNGSSWSAPTNIDSVWVDAVSCSSAAFCVAVDRAGTANAITYNGSSWSAPVAVAPGGSTGALTSVSCPSTSFCVVVGTAGSALMYSAGAPIVNLRVPSGPVARARPFLLDATGTLAGSSPIVGYRWSIGAASVSCSGQQPLLRAELPIYEKSPQVQVTLTALGANGQSSTASSTLVTSALSAPESGLLRSLPHFDPRPASQCTNPTAAGSKPMPPAGGNSYGKLGSSPPSRCLSDIKFGLIDARGCFYPATSSDPFDEEGILQNYLAAHPVCQQVGNRFSHHNVCESLSARLQTVESQSYYSYQPVRINGIGYYPWQGGRGGYHAAAILLDPVDDLVISTNATLAIDNVDIASGQFLQTVESVDQQSYTVGTFTLPQPLPQPIAQLGLGLTGSLSIEFVAGYRTKIDGSLAFPGLTAAETPQPIGAGFSYSINGGFAPATAGATLYTDNDNGLRINDLHVTLPIAYLGPLELDGLTVIYSGYASSPQNPPPSGWQCGTTSQAGELCGSIKKLRFWPGGPGAGASIDWLDGQIKAVSYNAIPQIPLGPFVTLSNLGGGVAFNPFYFTLEGSVTAFGFLSASDSMLIAFGSPSSPFALNQNETVPFGCSASAPSATSPPSCSSFSSSYPLSPLVGQSFSEPILAFGSSSSVSLPDPLGSDLIDGYDGIFVLPVNGASPYMQLGGSINTAFPFGIQATLKGEVGFTSKGVPAFNLTATANLAFTVPGLFTITSPKATAVLSSSGTAACGPDPIPNPLGDYVGIGWDGQYIDHTRIPLLSIWFSWSGCDMSKFSSQVQHSGDAAQSVAGERTAQSVAGDRTFTIPPGLRGEDVRLTGAAGAPSVRLTAPDGESLVVDQASGVTTAGRLIGGRIASLDQTILGVANPAPGTYTITPLPGSVAIASLQTAVMLPPLRISASVSGGGTRRALRYSVAPRPGQRVVLAEQGTGTYRVLRTINGGGRGLLRFTPAPGPGGRREIVAQVSLNGVPRPVLTIARFIAPVPPRLGIARLSARRNGRRVTVSWSATAGASRYVVILRLSTGSQRVLRLAGNRLSASFAGVPQTAAVTVLARGGSSVGRLGPLRVARLGATARFDNGVYPLGSRVPEVGRGRGHHR